jgi:hypothetical protein
MQVLSTTCILADKQKVLEEEQEGHEELLTIPKSQPQKLLEAKKKKQE